MLNGETITALKISPATHFIQYIYSADSKMEEEDVEKKTLGASADSNYLISERETCEEIMSVVHVKYARVPNNHSYYKRMLCSY
jgi:hypothetical protein